MKAKKLKLTWKNKTWPKKVSCPKCETTLGFHEASIRIRTPSKGNSKNLKKKQAVGKPYIECAVCHQEIIITEKMLKEL